MESTGNTKVISTAYAKTAHRLIGTTNLVIKYCYGKKVSSTKQKDVVNVFFGLSHQFINAEQNQND